MLKEGIVIIGTDASVSEKLRQSLEAVTQVLGVASDYASGYELVTTKTPDVLFIDLGPAPDQALELIERLAKELADLKIYVISKEKNPDLILKVVRLGVRDFFVLPGDESAIQRTIISLHSARETKVIRGRVLAFFSLLGGSGTTTLATNTAAFLAQDPEKQCIICDLDLYKGDVSYLLNMETEFTIVEFLQDLSRIDEELLHSSLARHPTGIYVLAHPNTFEDIEDITGEHVTRILQTLRYHFDYIVVDCLKAVNDTFLAVMDASDTIVLVTLQTVPALKNTKRCLELFEQLGYDSDKIKVVLNRFAKEKIFTIENIEKTLDWPIASAMPNLEQEATEAMNAGKLLQETRPKSKLTQEIATLGKVLMGVEPKAPSRPGFLSFLRKRG